MSNINNSTCMSSFPSSRRPSQETLCSGDSGYFNIPSRSHYAFISNSGYFLQREIMFKYNFDMECNNVLTNIFKKSISYLKLVFYGIRVTRLFWDGISTKMFWGQCHLKTAVVRTWVQIKNSPLIGRPDTSANQRPDFLSWLWSQTKLTLVLVPIKLWMIKVVWARFKNHYQFSSWWNFFSRFGMWKFSSSIFSNCCRFMQQFKVSGRICYGRKALIHS